MGKINLPITGGSGPYTITIREVNETSGNRYTGPNPTNTLTNLDVNYIKDNTPHLYSVNVANGTCAAGTTTFEQLCPCEFVPSFVASQICTNPQDPKISVTTSLSGGGFVQIRIFNSSNQLLHNITSVPGTQTFSVSNNGTYKVVVNVGNQDLVNCKAQDQFVNVNCVVECSLNVVVSNPIC